MSPSLKSSLAMLLMLLPGIARADNLAAVVYKSPACGCCQGYVDHLRENGFQVEVRDVPDLSPVKRQLGIPPELESCHTMEVGDYLVEGHVPVEQVRNLLARKPAIQGVALPGMPTGVPGMPGPRGVLTYYTIAEKPRPIDLD